MVGQIHLCRRVVCLILDLLPSVVLVGQVRDAALDLFAAIAAGKLVVHSRSSNEEH